MHWVFDACRYDMDSIDYQEWIVYGLEEKVDRRG